MPLTSAEWVRAHARTLSLAMLRTIIASGTSESEKLRSLHAPVAERACLDPAFRVWTAETTLIGAVPDAMTALKLIASPRESKTGPVFLPKTSALRRIVGVPLGDHLVPNEEIISDAWATAQSVLRELKLDALLSLLIAVDLIAGIRGPRGEVRALSNPQFPGFVAIGLDNPPLLIAEQAVHESMHVVLAARLALANDFAALTDDRVGILSPFTDTVRTIERVVHGVLSYAAVLAMWRAVATFASPESWMELSDKTKAYNIVARRVRTLETRLRLAMICLFDGAGAEVCRRTKQLAVELLNVRLPSGRTDNNSRARIVAEAGYTPDLSELTPIERGELALAMYEDKVSRLSVQLSRIPRIGFALTGHTAVAASSWTTYSMPDPKIGGFSNVSFDTTHILDSGGDREVHLYLHPKPAYARKAAILDRDDKAGGTFGIPACCRRWYSTMWPRTRETGGDLFSVMVRLAARNGRILVAAECDASAMYRGGGLCWHFPCSPQCRETVAVVDTRRKLLEKFDPSLLAELDRARRNSITILADGTYQDGEVNGAGALIVSFV